jgi:putative hemolysin
MSPASQLDALTQINLQDAIESFGLSHVRCGRRPLSWLFWPAARQFAHQIATYDQIVGQHGLPTGAEWLLKRYLHQLQVAGHDHVPMSGPLLVLSNHPGMADTAGLFVGVGRPDLHIVALDRPFLRVLPHTSRQLIYVPQSEGGRMAVARAVVGHLRAGRAVLTFPAGEIEPDPAVHGAANAIASLDCWSDSVSLFARRVPETKIVIAIVSGVQSPGAQRNPLTRLRRTQRDRERMAAMLQVLIPAYRGVTARIAFGPPLSAAELIAAYPDPASLNRAISAHARHLIEAPPGDWQTVLKGVY